jgi:RNA methyltransferase, TrmH family
MADLSSFSAANVSTVVTSMSNQWIKLCKEVATSNRARVEHKVVFLEGIHLCETYLKCVSFSKEPEASQLCLMLIGESHQYSREVASLRAFWSGRTLVASDKVFASISQVQNGPAIAMLVATPVSPFPTTCLSDWVYLDGLQDPGNAGTIIRTAVASGIEVICTSPGTVSLWSPKVLRSAMGGHFYLDIFESVNVADIVRAAEKGEAKLRAMAGSAQQTLYQTDLRLKTVWALGNEGQGLDLSRYMGDEHEKKTIELLSIPQRNVESLNVAVAASLCFYEQWRQRNTQ